MCASWILGWMSAEAGATCACGRHDRRDSNAGVARESLRNFWAEFCIARMVEAQDSYIEECMCTHVGTETGLAALAEVEA